ncbi:MAG TPA: hypothetical protein VGZ32_21520, partial [Actinocrinis sp.]|uniref:hypothetical protein n=1 Tax=Actinocrinis sp. TaxID=1920516 RepID=UPI002DDD3383
RLDTAAPQQRHLMAQYQDLGVQRRARASEQREPRQYATEDQIRQSRRYRPRSSTIQPHHINPGHSQDRRKEPPQVKPGGKQRT